MGLFSHVPGEQVSVRPSRAVPEIVGKEAGTGTGMVGSATGTTGKLTAGKLLPFGLLATTVQVIS